jgi:hypothetical protein
MYAIKNGETHPRKKRSGNFLLNVGPSAKNVRIHTTTAECRSIKSH